MTLRTGVHIIPLYEGPVPDVTTIPVGTHFDKKSWRRYNKKATIKIVVFDTPRGPDDVSSDEDDEADEISIPEVCTLL